MKCFQHRESDATGVCAWCGRAVCPECAPAAARQQLTCSSGCADALAMAHETQAQLASASQLLLQKSLQNARASAFYCYLCAGLSAGATVTAWFMLPSPFLMYFTGGCSVALVISGYLYGRSARHVPNRSLQTSAGTGARLPSPVPGAVNVQGPLDARPISCCDKSDRAVTQLR